MHLEQKVSNDQMTRIVEVARALAVTTDLDVLLRLIAEATTSLIGCERASIYLLNDNGEELWTKVALQSEVIRMPKHMGIAGQALCTDKILHTPHPYEEPRFNPRPDQMTGHKTRNLLTAPMHDYDGRP